MAPIRRYLRITLHSVLEVRIYLDEPHLAESWLLRARDPVLPRVIEAIRPYVIPKLREENEKAKVKGPKKRKKGIKDIVSTDDFEVSIFLTDITTLHTLLSKRKEFLDKQPRIRGNSTKLGVGKATTTANDVNSEDTPILVEEDDSEADRIRMEDIPEKTEQDDNVVAIDSSNDEEEEADRSGDEYDEGDDYAETGRAAAGSTTAQTVKRKRGYTPRGRTGEDDKKKLAVKTEYDGFTIYGKVLCLIVKRKGTRPITGFHGAASGSDMMENWVSTQAQPEEPPALV